MQVYLVGGAVRDQLLGRPVTERDWVVVGATPEQMLAQGYQQVGKDFPVFLHPQSKEEYALARTERKNGHGYHGFSCYAAADVTLEQDLLRRDLTINAIAQAEDGQLIDPYGGVADLHARRLRHVSDAFSEDPLRVLRVARFAARYHYLGFSVADDTLALMTKLANSGELGHLAKERIWQEWHKSLEDGNPQIFLQVLARCHALAALLPELDNPNYLTAQQQLLTEVSERHQANSALAQFCLQIAPWFVDTHSACAVDEIAQQFSQLAERLRIPNELRDYALLLGKFSSALAQFPVLSAEQRLTLFNQLDVWRRAERLTVLLPLVDALSRWQNPNHAAANWREAVESALLRCQQITAQQFIAQGLQGKAIAAAIEQARLAIIISDH